MTTMRARDARGEAGREPVDRTAAAKYVAELSAELANLARRHGLDALGYILDMARLEAENATRHVTGGAKAAAASPPSCPSVLRSDGRR